MYEDSPWVHVADLVPDSRLARVSPLSREPGENVGRGTVPASAARRKAERSRVRRKQAAPLLSAQSKRLLVLASAVVVGLLCVVLMFFPFETFSFGPLTVNQSGFDYAAGVITDQGVTMAVDDPFPWLLIVPFCGLLTMVFSLSAYFAGHARRERAQIYTRRSGHLVAFMGALIFVGSLLSLTGMVPPSAAFFYMGYYAQILPAAGIFLELLLGPLVALMGYLMARSYGSSSV